MKKLLVFHPALGPYRVDFFNALAENFDVDFLFYYKGVQGQKLDNDFISSRLKARSEYFKPVAFIKSRPFFFGKSFFKIRKEKPDVIVLTELQPITIELIILKMLGLVKQPLVSIIDNSVLEFQKKHRSGFGAWLYRFLCRRLDGMIVLSEPVKQLYGQYFPPERIVVSPLIQNERVFRCNLEEAIPVANATIKSLELTGKKIIICVARHVEVKNLAFLLQAFNSVEKRHQAKLVLIGEGFLTLTLKAQAASMGQKDIIFMGTLEKLSLWSWFVIGQLHVLPSVFELYGAVVNESLLSGCRNLVSENAGAADLIRSAEQGVIFSPYDLAHLTDVLNRELAALSPLEECKTLRPSLMPISFRESADAAVEFLSRLKT